VTKKQYSLMLMLALVAGLVGGVVSSKFLMGQPVFAESAKPQKIIVAEKFVLVDKQGNKRDEMGVKQKLLDKTKTEAYLELRAPDGNEEAELTSSGLSLCSGEWTGRWFGKSRRRPCSANIVILDSAGGGFLHMAGLEDDASPWIMLEGGRHGEPMLRLTQGEKTRAVLGSSEITVTRTGERRRLSPSSLVLFAEDGKVIWQAP